MLRLDLIIILILLSVGIILLVLNKIVLGVSIIVVTTVGTAILFIYRYKFEDKIISSKIAEITDSKNENPSSFNTLCDRLFKNQGKETYDQYLDMVSKRSEYESANLCKNLARQKLAT